MFREDNINIDWRKLPQARGLTSDNTMLSDRGRRQAKECAARFRNVNITNVFASPFDRTIQTASIIADEKNLLVKPEPGLCEALHHCCDPPGFWTPEKLKEKYPLVDAKYIPAFPRTSLPKQEFGDNECKPRIRVTLNRLTEKYDGTMDS
ncbi:hypothetical protein Y032_0112g275 [Ancylostoma ceylanicum]|uniref:Phosphoglycerate mutase family protein n=1 Tax=Ancylostoma ceylanicum TaxID=53326 RepID=A0A016TDN2_9BILA|nr:hypothetical protein Y032_0112g275 [Ancylostoma ceylanicum]